MLEIHGTADQVVPYGGKPPDYNGSVKRWLGQWRRIDGCHGKADRLKPAPGVTEIAWRHCSAGTRVEHVRLDGQAHGWPGGPRTDAAARAVRRDVADVAVLPQPPAAAARRVSA